MPTYTPNTLIPFTDQPFMSQVLRIEVMNFEGAVVYMRSRVSIHEESMVIRVCGSNIEMKKSGDIFANRGVLGVRVDVEEVCRYEVEGSCVPVKF